MSPLYLVYIYLSWSLTKGTSRHNVTIFYKYILETISCYMLWYATIKKNIPIKVGFSATNTLFEP